MKKRTRALQIPREVKERVFERDMWCVYCGKPGAPNAHYISRSQGGLGIEENILTLCTDCHGKYDQTIDRAKMREYFKEYLQSKYPEWDEENLIYRK